MFRIDRCARFAFLSYSNSLNRIVQRFTSNEKTTRTAALPVGTGLSTVKGSDNLPVIYTPSLFTRLKMKFGLQGDLREPQKILYQATAISYYMITSTVDFERLQRELDMADVYSSYGKMIFLHVWFLLLRYIQMGKVHRRNRKFYLVFLFRRTDGSFSSTRISSNDVGRSRSSSSTNSSGPSKKSTKSTRRITIGNERLYFSVGRRNR